MRRIACGSAAVVVALAIAAPASGKEGMTATLLRPVQLDAMPGTTVRVVWRISQQSASAARDDDRFYVRLDSAIGSRSTHAYGSLRGRRYVARVRVPRGGISRIRIFLKGWMSYPGGGRRADMEIPITNDPL